MSHNTLRGQGRIAADIGSRWALENVQGSSEATFTTEQLQDTEVVFLLLAADTARGTNSKTHQNSHLGPRVLAAELAVMVADPDSKLHKTLTLRKAVALKFRIGGKQLRKDLAHNDQAVDMLPEYGGDDSSTATTLSEDSDDDDSQNLQPTHGKPRLTAHEARSARRDSSNIWAPVT